MAANKFEYKITLNDDDNIRYDQNTPEEVTRMNKMGEQGWELVAVVPLQPIPTSKTLLGQMKMWNALYWKKQTS